MQQNAPAARGGWLALSYQAPISPSRARVYVWRKLHDIGAILLRQGIAVLPQSTANAQSFARLAQKIRQMDGEAQLLEFRFLEPLEEARMKSRFQKQIEKEYRELIEDCSATLRRLENSAPNREPFARILRRYRKAYSRDFFRYGAASAELETGLRELLDTVNAALR